MANYNSQYTGEQIDAAIGAVINGQGGGLSNEAKAALLACFEKVAWIDDQGQTYYDALYDALNPPTNIVSISAVYTQGGTVYTTDTLDDLKSDLVVTAYYDDSTTQTITTYTLSGTLTEGTSTITVTYMGKTTTFNVTVTAAPLYALPNNEVTTEYYKLTTTSHGHVEIEIINAMSSSISGTGGFAVNLKTGVIAETNNAGLNNQSATFTFPANASVVWGVENVVNALDTQFSGNFRVANSSSSNSGTGLGNITTDTTVTATISNATNIYYPFIYVFGNPLPSGTKIAFDMFVNVNNIKYI